MNIVDDRLWIALNRDDNEFQGKERFLPLLERLQNSFVPRPTRLQVGGRAERHVESYMDPQVLKALDRRKGEVRLSNPEQRLDVSIWQLPERTAIGIFFPLAQSQQTESIRELFLDLVKIVSPTYARCHLDRQGRVLHDLHYSAHSRTFYADGLFWLNFFGPEEEARQGGPALANNPYAHVERLPQGLFIEVGRSPLDATTPEGERRLIQATSAMPPLNKSVTSQMAEEPTQNGVNQDKAELTTIDGIRGFLNPDDHSFWVTKHLLPGSAMNARTISHLRNLVGKGDPPITQVHVLFSLKEAAERNRAALSAAGIRTWYVDQETGQPKEISDTG